MSLNDKLRLGGLSREEFDELAQRVENLESAAQGDGAAVPSIYTINKAGEVTVTENTTIVEAPEVEEGEGDLLIVEGGKTKRLKPGPKGDFLSSDGKKLKWVPAPEGGAGLNLASGETTVKWEEGESAESSTKEIATGLGKAIKSVILPGGVLAPAPGGLPCFLRVFSGPEDIEKRWSAGNFWIRACSVLGKVAANTVSGKFRWVVLY